MGLKKLSFVSNPDAHKALLEWWNELDAARGDRAELRRCHNPMEVVFNPAYHRLRWKLSQFGNVNREGLAVVAGVLAHVKKNNENADFATQMASPKAGSYKALVSGLRFRRLLKIEDRNDLFGPMIRTVRLLDGNVNIASIADSVYWWNDITRKKWAYSYYDKAPKED